MYYVFYSIYLPTYLVDECEFLCVKVIIFFISYMNNLWSCLVAISGLQLTEFTYFQASESETHAQNLEVKLFFYELRRVIFC